MMRMIGLACSLIWAALSLMQGDWMPLAALAGLAGYGWLVSKMKARERARRHADAMAWSEREQMAKIKYLEEAQEREEEERERRRPPRPAAPAAPITWTEEEPTQKAQQGYMDFPEGRLPPEAAKMTEQMRQTLARKLGEASEETKRIVAEYMAAQGRA